MLRTAILLALLTGILISVGGFFGGAKGMTVMFVVAVFMNFVSYWYSDKIVLNMYGAREVFADQAPLAATLIQLAISRTREYEADETGGLLAGNPLSLASALEKIEAYSHSAILPSATHATSHLFIVNPFSGAGNWTFSLFSTHPTTEERVTRLAELAGRMPKERIAS